MKPPETGSIDHRPKWLIRENRDPSLDRSGAMGRTERSAMLNEDWAAIGHVRPGLRTPEKFRPHKLGH